MSTISFFFFPRFLKVVAKKTTVNNKKKKYFANGHGARKQTKNSNKAWRGQNQNKRRDE